MAEFIAKVTLEVHEADGSIRTAGRVLSRSDGDNPRFYGEIAEQLLHDAGTAVVNALNAGLE